MNLDTANVHEEGEGSASTTPPNVTPAALVQLGAAVTAAADKPPRKRKPRARRAAAPKVSKPARVMIEADIMCEVIDLPAAAIVADVVKRQQQEPRRPWWRQMLSI
jgi:hypothetical protein